MTPSEIEAAVLALWRNYQTCEAANLTPSGAVQLQEWVVASHPKAIAIRDWVSALYAECYAKEDAIRRGETVDMQPSTPWKPYSFREAAAEAAGILPAEG
jgi:hypothetical protein